MPRIGLGLGMGTTSGGVWTPAKLTGFNSSVLVALSRGQGKLWQNSGKTTPAVADGDPVRVATCPYAGVDFTAPSDAARPTLRNSGAFWWLAFDGVDDVLQRTMTLNQPYSVYGSALILTASGTLCDGQTVNTGYIARNGGNPASYGISAGTNLNSSNTVLAANTVIVGANFNGASSVVDLAGTETTGPAGATNLTAVTVGGRTGIPTLFCDRLYGLIYAGALSAAEKAKNRAYLATLGP